MDFWGVVEGRETQLLWHMDNLPTSRSHIFFFFGSYLNRSHLRHLHDIFGKHTALHLVHF